MTQAEFSRRFKELTGKTPLSWQWRLFRDHFVKGDFYDTIDLPTGLGKTMVMAIWLIAREINDKLPRRLVYVVDRRTVVDQATDIAEQLQQKVGKGKLAVSTLRGHLADNRDWSRDLSQPAIIVGTVDLIGSALLFSGYRSSFKRRPLEAGLLGQDSLLVLDEAHLSKPFDKLLTSITHFQRGQGLPTQIIRMSATGDGPTDGKAVFGIDTDKNSPTFDLEPDPDPKTGDERNQIALRYKARKRLVIEQPVESKKLNEALANAAIRLAKDLGLVGKRIVVFVRSPGDAREIASIVRDYDKPGRTKANPDLRGPFSSSVEVLTGTMRGLERDELVETPVFQKRWLNGDLDPSHESNQAPVFLISTSAGEVGFDLNADHMISDQTTIESFIQRLGRVNRRGGGKARIILIPTASNSAAESGKRQKRAALDEAVANTLELLAGQSDVSPKALGSLKKRLAKDVYTNACAPDPQMVELTDILLDAWSMTSITERMPGRPEVAPWLRGIADEQPETTIAWRAELTLFREQANPDAENALKAVFAKHPIRPHESLTIPSYRAIEFLKEVAKSKGGRAGLVDERVAIRRPRGEIVIHTVGELIDDPRILDAEPTLILPAMFGGLDGRGMLSADAIAHVTEPICSSSCALDVADHRGYEQRDGAATRFRMIMHRTEEGIWIPKPFPGGVNISDHPRLKNLSESYGSSGELLTDLRGAVKSDKLRILVQAVELDYEDEPVSFLVMLTPIVNKDKHEDQSLADHVTRVESEAQKIAKALRMNGPFRDALFFAARWHDEGKKADIWQRFACRADSDAYKGKSAKTRDPKSLCGYRHEFGSLARILHPERRSTDCRLPIDPDVSDLAMHLIATHHGFGRPHFNAPFDRDFKAPECEAWNCEVIRRFARLQRKYGHWQLAWLENLLRCADALASADDVSEDDVVEPDRASGEDS